MLRIFDFALTRFPSLYGRLTAGRHHPNLDKVIFLALLRKDDVVVDVGANLGFYSLLFSDLVGLKGAVHIFEPVPTTFDRLRRNLDRRARFNNFVLNQAALGEQDRTATIWLPDADHGQASLAHHTAGSWTGPAVITSHDCVVQTLDGYATGTDLGAWSLMKCDVEGAELLVLQGARRTIQERLPILYLETSRRWAASFGYQPADLLRFLEPLGYSSFYLVFNDHIRLLEPGNREVLPADYEGSANLLCCHGTLHDVRLRRLRRWLPKLSGEGR